MNIVRWPEPMPESGRLPMAKDAYDWGICKVADPLMSCPQTLHLNLFFDGTNNNDSPDNPYRDSLTQSQTNIARLFDATKDLPGQGIFKFYMPGVGTPFPQIGEPEYSSMGKAFGRGYGTRVAWGYTRVLNAIYRAIKGDFRVSLLDDEIAYSICRKLDNGVLAETALATHYTALKTAHHQARTESRRHRTIRKVWINVFGFSRGAAEARSFASRLIDIWAPGGKIAGEFEYAVNFLGLFDTVASVGVPDSGRLAIPAPEFNGHWDWACNGQLNIPQAVRRCVHFVAIHEQRMSFPLDTIRVGSAYQGEGDRLLEVAYPGVHSDVGGGYAPGEQGKSRGGDAYKLSQIPLHDMYIQALRAGVPMVLKDEIEKSAQRSADFALAPELAQTFNDWLKTTSSIYSIEQALQFGMAQMLAWRTLRARVGDGDYVTQQPFFQHAPESSRSREQVREETRQLNQNDTRIEQLRMGNETLEKKIGAACTDANANPMARHRDRPVDLQSEIDEYQQQIQDNHKAIARAQDANMAQAAGVDPTHAKPGNTPDDLVTSDKTDLLEAAEEFRLLLTWLNPEQASLWRTRIVSDTRLPLLEHEAATRQHPPDSKILRMADTGALSHAGSVVPFSVYDDAVITPLSRLKAFFQQHTSPHAVEQLRKPPGVVQLYDDYVHDSRAWFRVPYFREYVPGGFFWARLLFVGGDTRVEYLGI